MIIKCLKIFKPLRGLASRRGLHTLWTSIVVTGCTAHIIPHKAVCDSQGVDTVFIVEVIGLTLGPICKAIGLTIRPNKCTLAVSVIQSNPTPGSIQTMLHVNILFLISNAYEVGVVILTGLLSFSPVLARLTGWVANTRKVWPSWFTNIYKKEHKNYYLLYAVI